MDTFLVTAVTFAINLVRAVGKHSSVEKIKVLKCNQLQREHCLGINDFSVPLLIKLFNEKR